MSGNSALTRDQIREQIFNTKPMVKQITFMGVEVDLREPPMDVVLDFQASDAENRKFQVAKMMQNYVYVPGTEDPVFEDGDVEAILKLPFGRDMQLLQNEIMQIMGVQPTASDKSQAPVERNTVVDPDDSGASGD